MKTPDRIALKHLGIAAAGIIGTYIGVVLLLQAASIAIPPSVSGLGVVGAWLGIGLRRAVTEAYAAGLHRA
ncbi:MAG: hypothetical protein VX265_04815 [Myxococcota bacterium]|nr:hypothetical protein [Myxococcota bacterium]